MKKKYYHVTYEHKKNNDYLIEVDDVIIKKLQSELLQMYIDIFRVCEAEGISVFLIGGSALGAIRHGGFIPWDDDLDISMTRADYNRFKMIFEKSLGEEYALSSPNNIGGFKAKQRFPKVLKKNSKLREIIDVQDTEQHRIFVDIFILDSIPTNIILRYFKGFKCNLLEFIAGEELIYQNMDDASKQLLKSKGNSNYYKHLLLGKLFSYRKYWEWFDLVDDQVQYNKNEANFYGLTTGTFHYFGGIMEKNVVFPKRECSFEGVRAYVFNNVEKYLTNSYGDYMEIPPIEKRETHFLRELDFGEDR